MEIQEKIQELMEKKEFVEAFGKVSNAQEVVELFGNNGVEVPVEVAQELFEQDERDLNEEELDEVAGGGWISWGIEAAYYGAGYLGGRLAGWSKKDSRKYAKNCQKIGGFLGDAFEFVLGG